MGRGGGGAGEGPPKDIGQSRMGSLQIDGWTKGRAREQGNSDNTGNREDETAKPQESEGQRHSENERERERVTERGGPRRTKEGKEEYGVGRG